MAQLWPRLPNSRFQKNEKSISPADVPLLSPAWSFSTVAGEGDAKSEGDITGTPVVADGCVYVATNRSWVFALNADTGKEVWRTKLPRGGSANGTVGLGKRRCNKTTKRVRVKRSKREMRRLPQAPESQDQEVQVGQADALAALRRDLRRGVAHPPPPTTCPPARSARACT